MGNSVFLRRGRGEVWGRENSSAEVNPSLKPAAPKMSEDPKRQIPNLMKKGEESHALVVPG